jgi:small subunit ribosomal protein S3
MGQKVNPNGFRVGITQKHKSIWFSNPNRYSTVLKEDIVIRKFLAFKLREFNIAFITIHRKQFDIYIEINSYNAGAWVTLDFETLEKLRLSLYLNLFCTFQVKRKIFLSVKEISNPDAYSSLIAQDMVLQLEKRTPFRLVIKSAIQKACQAGVKGVKIQISGRLNGIEIARKEWSREGRVPLHTLNANINFARARALTIFGILGIKVWIYQPFSE